MVLASIFLSVKRFIIRSLIGIIEFWLGPLSLKSLAIDNRLRDTEKVQRVEWALRRNSNDRLRNYDWESGNETDEADELLEDEVSDTEFRADLAKNLSASLRTLKGYKKLVNEVEEKRSDLYDSNNPEHEKKLMRLWRLLKPDTELEARKTKQWQELGFQGDDPATDFRGMGILGLDQLLFFAQFDVDKCERVMVISEDQIVGFPFAIAGITFTSICRQLLLDGLLKNHFINACHQPATIDNFHQVYCRLFYLFAEYWIHSSPSNVMSFNLVKTKFINTVESYLACPDSNLLDILPEDIYRLAAS